MLASTQLPDISIIPWQRSMTLDPISRIFQVPDDQREVQMAAWKEAKLGELMFVGLTSALISAVISGGFSWTLIDSPHSDLARGIWYGGLMIAIIAITLAMQQSIALHRIGGHSEGLQRLMSCLAKQSDGVWRPRRMQVLIWQMPVMLLNVSIFVFVIGLLVLVLSNFRAEQESLESVVLLLIAFCFSAGCYLVSTVSLYSSMK